MRNNNFKTKEDYLRYRKDWKRDYLELSLDIRNRKYYLKEYYRAYNKIRRNVDPDNQWNRFYDQVDELLEKDKRFQELKIKYKPEKYWNLNKFKKWATGMLRELKLAKEEARRQYLESRKTA